jgi:TRAP-type C4-dicarboxylate transport system substrate-binding protein
MNSAKNPEMITYYCGQKISEMTREDLEEAFKEAAKEIIRLMEENNRLRRNQFNDYTMQ